MFSFKKYPYNLLLLLAILILVTSFFISTEGAIDLHLHDTYFIISKVYLFWLVSGVLIVFWVLNSITKRFLFSKILTSIHLALIGLSAICLIGLLLYAHYYYQGLAGMPRRYYDYSRWEDKWAIYDNFTKASVITLVSMLLGIAVYFMHLVMGEFKFLKRKNGG